MFRVGIIARSVAHAAAAATRVAPSRVLPQQPIFAAIGPLPRCSFPTALQVGGVQTRTITYGREYQVSIPVIAFCFD
jgi:hypothetical protein